MRKAGMAAAVLGIALNLTAATARCESLKVVSSGQATKMATERFVVHSTRLDRDVPIEVTQPFAPLAAGQKVPAVYLLDGGYEFAGLEGWLLGGAGGMAQAFMVGVGSKPADYPKRDADLTTQPVEHRGRVEAGRAMAYRAFLLEELRPFIEARYAVDPRQAVLVGHSLGGSFAASLFADRPTAFSAYVIGSPALQNEAGLMARVIAAKGGGERIFIAAGTKESAEVVSSADQIATALRAKPGLTVRSQVFAGATHLSYYPELIAEGLGFVLPPSAP
ncbi:MAG: alpha/beta hydrolase [Phenylobacterium sp.]